MHRAAQLARGRGGPDEVGRSAPWSCGICNSILRLNRASPNHSRLAVARIVEENSSVREMGKFLVILGAITVLLGLVLWSGFAPKWLGRLPGDIRIEREHSAFYFPIVTCIIISILLSLILSIFRR
jgi:hypothetical protein